MEEGYKSLSSLLQEGHNTEEKAKPMDLPKAIFGRVLLQGLAVVENPSGLQQERHEKRNWCDQARKCPEGQLSLGDI